VTVIDYGLGNLLSVKRGLEYCGAKVILSSEPEIILSSKRIILPGVGAFSNAMDSLKKLDLVDVIREVANRKIPLLGICLGMQLLFDQSEEFGVTAGLGLIPGKVVSITVNTRKGERQKVPHIGWSEINMSNESTKWQNTILKSNQPGDALYFVHSFMASPNDVKCCYSECLYGDTKIVAVVIQDNITGCQFHPEKSGEMGLKILRNFLIQ